MQVEKNRQNLWQCLKEGMALAWNDPLKGPPLPGVNLSLQGPMNTVSMQLHLLAWRFSQNLPEAGVFRNSSGAFS